MPKVQNKRRCILKNFDFVAFKDEKIRENRDELKLTCRSSWVTALTLVGAQRSRAIARKNGLPYQLDLSRSTTLDGRGRAPFVDYKTLPDRGTLTVPTYCEQLNMDFFVFVQNCIWFSLKNHQIVEIEAALDVVKKTPVQSTTPPATYKKHGLAASKKM